MKTGKNDRNDNTEINLVFNLLWMKIPINTHVWPTYP